MPDMITHLSVSMGPTEANGDSALVSPKWPANGQPLGSGAWSQESWGWQCASLSTKALQKACLQFLSHQQRRDLQHASSPKLAHVRCQGQMYCQQMIAECGLREQALQMLADCWIQCQSTFAQFNRTDL